MDSRNANLNPKVGPKTSKSRHFWGFYVPIGANLDSSDFAYTTTWNSDQFQYNQKTTTVTTYDLVRGTNFQTVYTYSGAGVQPQPSTGEYITTQMPVESQIQYYDWNGGLLKTVNKSWNFSSPNEMTCESTTLGSVTSRIDYAYLLLQGPSGFYTSMDLVTDKKEWDWGTAPPCTSSDSGTPLRETTTNYNTFTTPIFAGGPSILDKPSQVTVYGSGTQVAQTTYAYTETVSSAGVTTGRDSNYNANSSIARGNESSITRWLSAGGTSPVTTYNYDDTGQVTSMIDPCGNTACSDMTGSNHTTSYGYSNDNGYLATVTYPNTGVAHTESFTYNNSTGEVASATDENGKITSYTYNDPFARLTETDYPDTGKTTLSYNDTAPTPSVTTTKVMSSSQSIVSTAISNGMGLTTETELTSDPQGTDKTDTSYDGLGRINTVTNPYRSTGDPTYGTTTYAYDALGRTTSVTKPDSGVVSTVYSNNCTTVTDEAAKNRESCTDGLGRMTQVIENPGGLGYTTNYTYDALDDLGSVVQGGSRNRSFTFDSLKRMTQSTNPEPGSVTYVYDANGNATTKTDGRSITTTYSYDELNRVTGMTYSNSDPSVSYTYDQSACLGQSACYNVGHRTTITDAGGNEEFAYDTMGREIAEQRTTNSITKSTSYTYDLVGNMLTLTYPSTRMITYAYDSAGRPAEAADIANNINYVVGACSDGIDTDGVCYAPNGSVAQIQNGTNLVSTYIYNTRFQPCWMYATTGTVLATNTTCTASDPGPGNILDLQYNFNLGSGDNGNVVGITNKRDTTRTLSFTYDALNRIATGKTSSTSGSHCWGETYTVDQWGNLTAIGALSGYTGCTQESLSVSATTSNQLSATGYSYDAAGNMLTDGANTYAYNAESEIKSAAGVTYTYDGDGNRLEKVSQKIYWYGAGTEILDESNSSGTFTNEYVFFGGKRVAMRSVSSGTIYYYEDDMLGSARTMVQAGQTSLCYDADFYPFGGERDITTTCSQNYKFEGKERDTETGNDDFGARYYTSRLGRWLSADWSAVPAPVPYANLTNPQTLNLYAMVSDNPETFADLDGHLNPDGGPYNLETGDSSAGQDEDGHRCDFIGGDCSKQENVNGEKDKQASDENEKAKQQNSDKKKKDDPETPSPTQAGGGKGGGQQRKGERRTTRKPEFKNKPDKLPKGVRINPDKPGQYQVLDPHTGNWVDKGKGWSPYAQKVGMGASIAAGAAVVGRAGVAVGRAIVAAAEACVESGLCEVP